MKQTSPMSPAASAMLNLIVASSRVEEGMEKILESYGITRRQYNVLRILRGVYPNGHPRSEVSARMVDRAPDVTRLIDRLVHLGFVERVRGTTDKRESIAKLTSKGAEVMHVLDPLVADYIEHIFGGLFTKEECLTLSVLCERTYEDEV
ncbi:MAG: MarR family transcriptional regulator [Bacteroidetes bacterium]|nr:MarR family transcriptional regulator [Bacteroidota bacterium]